jgi:hypothetical protein
MRPAAKAASQRRGTETDHLASQGSLAYDASHRLLIAVNGGSDSVSTFSVHGDRLQLRSVVPSGGQFPASIAVRGKLVYVLNSGGSGIVQGFRIAGDRLVRVPGSARSLSLANTDASVLKDACLHLRADGTSRRRGGRSKLGLHVRARVRRNAQGRQIPAGPAGRSLLDHAGRALLLRLEHGEQHAQRLHDRSRRPTVSGRRHRHRGHDGAGTDRQHLGARHVVSLCRDGQWNRGRVRRRAGRNTHAARRDRRPTGRNRGDRVDLTHRIAARLGGLLLASARVALDDAVRLAVVG